MKKIKRVGLDLVLTSIKEGKSPAQISKELNINKKTLWHYTTKLKKLGCIERVGYGAWNYLKEVPKVPKGRASGGGETSFKQVRAHAFTWKIAFYDPIDWHKIMPPRRKIKTLTFQKAGQGKGYFRTVFKGRKVWLTTDGMVIYEPFDFFARSSFEGKGKAVFEMDLLVKQFLRKMGLRFRDYRFTPSREHYALVKNELAKQYNDKKEKMYIKGDDGTAWMWIDHSKGEHELENKEPVASRQVQNYYNNHKKHKFKHDGDFIENESKKVKDHDKVINKSMEVLEGYSEQIALHLEVEKQQLITQKETQRILALMEEKLR